MLDKRGTGKLMAGRYEIRAKSHSHKRALQPIIEDTEVLGRLNKG
jgi:hypothetical protein